MKNIFLILFGSLTFFGSFMLTADEETVEEVVVVITNKGSKIKDSSSLW